MIYPEYIGKLINNDTPSSVDEITEKQPETEWKRKFENVCKPTVFAVDWRWWWLYYDYSLNSDFIVLRSKGLEPWAQRFKNNEQPINKLTSFSIIIDWFCPRDKKQRARYLYFKYFWILINATKNNYPQKLENIKWYVLYFCIFALNHKKINESEIYMSAPLSLFLCIFHYHNSVSFFCILIVVVVIAVSFYFWFPFWFVSFFTFLLAFFT
jgi:hypothetical protein